MSDTAIVVVTCLFAFACVGALGIVAFLAWKGVGGGLLEPLAGFFGKATDGLGGHADEEDDEPRRHAGPTRASSIYNTGKASQGSASQMPTTDFDIAVQQARQQNTANTFGRNTLGAPPTYGAQSVQPPAQYPPAQPPYGAPPTYGAQSVQPPAQYPPAQPPYGAPQPPAQFGQNQPLRGQPLVGQPLPGQQPPPAQYPPAQPPYGAPPPNFSLPTQGRASDLPPRNIPTPLAGSGLVNDPPPSLRSQQRRSRGDVDDTEVDDDLLG
jgi:hypothetical protein